MALLGDDRRSSLDQGLHRESVQITCATFNICAGFAEVLPIDFQEFDAMGRLNRVLLLGDSRTLRV
jgi:hypothetical protein